MCNCGYADTHLHIRILQIRKWKSNDIDNFIYGSKKNFMNYNTPLKWYHRKRTVGKGYVIGGSAAAGYAIYRGLRMLPSLAPPLWWTIPANIVTP